MYKYKGNNYSMRRSDGDCRDLITGKLCAFKKGRCTLPSSTKLPNCLFNLDTWMFIKTRAINPIKPIKAWAVVVGSNPIITPQNIYKTRKHARICHIRTIDKVVKVEIKVIN